MWSRRISSASPFTLGYLHVKHFNFLLIYFVFFVGVVCIRSAHTLFFSLSLSLRLFTSSISPYYFFNVCIFSATFAFAFISSCLQFLVALLPFTCYFICWFNRVLKLPSCDCCCRRHRRPMDKGGIGQNGQMVYDL